MLINRLYKTKNTQNTGKPMAKNEDDTKLLFYVRLLDIVANPQEVIQGEVGGTQAQSAPQNWSCQETQHRRR